MTVLTEKLRGAHFLMSEAAFHRSRDNVTLLAGQGPLQAGTVLGKVTASGKYVISPATGADGSEAGAAILLESVEANAADVKVAVISRDAEVNGNQLIFAASVNDNAKIATKVAELAASPKGIITRY